MTLPSEQIGDKGQRYVVQAKGYPDHANPDWQDIGYTHSKTGAQLTADGIRLVPSVTAVQIVDRKEKP